MNNNNDLILKLQTILTELSDGDWEHGCGIQISSLDNPGWHVKIDLEGTFLENISFKEVNNDKNELDWVTCQVHDNIFEGFGGCENLGAILDIFWNWYIQNITTVETF